MPTYISLLKWTEQGIKNVKGTVDRAEEVRRTIEAQGGRLLANYWTQGAYDIVTIFEAPDEDTAMAGLLAAGMQGNVRSETLRAFSAEEMRRILGKLG